jgi:hypothetical protein
MLKEWMKGPFLGPENISSDNRVPSEIIYFPELFDLLFDVEDQYSAFVDFWTFYYTKDMTVKEAETILSNFSRCESCGAWFDTDELVDTETMIGGGVDYVCEDCANTLG